MEFLQFLPIHAFFWGHFQSYLGDILCTIHFMMHVDPLLVLTRDPWVVPAGPMISCALWKISGGLGGRTGFIYQIIYHWASIRWEGEMLHDLSELKLGFGYFRHDCLERFQGDTAGY